MPAGPLELEVYTDKGTGNLRIRILGARCEEVEAKQFVLSDKRYSTRQRILKSDTAKSVSKTA